MNSRMEELYTLIDKYNYHYYQLNESLISDYEFDQLLKELRELEVEFPEFVRENSPTKVVGGYIDNRFIKETLTPPMISLDNIFSMEELYEFDQRIKELIKEPFSYVCELKIDGLAMRLEYKDHHLIKGITRGDGKIGENVTHNILTIKNIPKELDYDLLVSGEVYINKENFLKINEINNNKYKNPRNLASGSMRQLDSNITKQRNLEMRCYGLVNPEKYHCDTYYDAMLFLQSLGFSINEKICKCDNIESVKAYILEITKMRETFKYDIDGIVIKVNEYALQNQLGNTAKYPRWAIAYKFKSSSVETQIEDIILSVGRSGKITPVAILKPVYLMGSIISKATLHNFNYIKEKDIRIGDSITLIKAGDIIPRVESVNLNKRDGQQQYVLPKICPTCASKLVNIDSDLYCPNTECLSRHEERLIHFISRDAMNIDGIGEKTIIKLIEKGKVKKYIDIFSLTANDFYELEGFKEKSVTNALNSIKKSLNVAPSNFLYALGIKQVGLETSKIILDYCGGLKQLLTLSQNELETINNIGSEIANNIINYFQNKENLQDYLLMINKYLINTEVIKTKIDQDNYFYNKIIVITGTLQTYNRNELKNKLISLGAKITNSISSKTNILICGEKPGSKYQKAQALGINIIQEPELLTKLGEL